VVLKLGRAQGAALTAAVMKGIPVAEYAPRKAKIAICGNGAASKEQVAMMIQKTLKVELDSKFLDATDALAIALCHHYQMSNPLAGAGRKTDWKKFLQDNPERIKK
jgi:crossover junction endodeoxyribonuclease RuvC